MIYYDQINNELKNLKTGSSIFIIRAGDKHIRKVYYSGYRNNSHWGYYNTYDNHVNLSSKNTSIVKIGNHIVETKDEFKGRIKALKAIEKEILIKDAYERNKRYPSID